jgi:hypothetical protein
MDIDFSKVKSLTIPEGSVKQLLIDGKTVWRAKADIEQLSAPTISLDGDTLTMTADDKTEEFVIFVDGVEMATVANEEEPIIPQIITFTIDGTPYQAVDGMTWGEWVGSEYNTGGFYVYLTGNQIWDAFGYVGTKDGVSVLPSDIIIGNGYSVTNMQGGGNN